MTRFFVTPEEMEGTTICLTGENAAHAKVLRLKAGEEITACDGQGSECLCRVETADGGQYTLSVVSRGSSETEAAVRGSVSWARSWTAGRKLLRLPQSSPVAAVFPRWWSCRLMQQR